METGDRNGFCKAVPGSLRIVPWANGRRRGMLLTMHAERGEPLAAIRASAYGSSIG